MKKYFDKLYKKSCIEFYELLLNDLKNNKKRFIVTANPETFNLASNDLEFNKILIDKSTTITPDGIGIVKSARLLKYDIKERITGVDIATKLLELSSNMKKKVYIFGSKQEVINSMKKIIKNKYPNVNLVGATNGYVKDKDKTFSQIAKLEPDVVLVALGIPAQEKLIYKHLTKFKKGIFIGVGGSFDVISGSKKRAPKLFIKLNLEWLYRIICEPKRLKRFWNNNVKFIIKIMLKKKSFFD